MPCKGCWMIRSTTYSPLLITNGKQIYFCWNDWWNVAIGLFFCRMFLLEDIRYSSQHSIENFLSRLAGNEYIHISSSLFWADYTFPSLMSMSPFVQAMLLLMLFYGFDVFIFSEIWYFWNNVGYSIKILNWR